MALIVFAYFSKNFSGCMNERSMFFFPFKRSLMNSETINYYHKAAVSQISVRPTLYSELNLVIFSTIVDLFSLEVGC